MLKKMIVNCCEAKGCEEIIQDDYKFCEDCCKHNRLGIIGRPNEILPGKRKYTAVCEDCGLKNGAQETSFFENSLMDKIMSYLENKTFMDLPIVLCEEEIE